MFQRISPALTQTAPYADTESPKTHLLSLPTVFTLHWKTVPKEARVMVRVKSTAWKIINVSLVDIYHHTQSPRENITAVFRKNSNYNLLPVSVD